MPLCKRFHNETITHSAKLQIIVGLATIRLQNLNTSWYCNTIIPLPNTSDLPRYPYQYGNVKDVTSKISNDNYIRFFFKFKCVWSRFKNDLWCKICVVGLMLMLNSFVINCWLVEKWVFSENYFKGITYLAFVVFINSDLNVLMFSLDIIIFYTFSDLFQKFKSTKKIPQYYWWSLRYYIAYNYLDLTSS